MSKEIWKDIPGYESRYRISTKGTVERKEYTRIYAAGKKHTYPSRCMSTTKWSKPGKGKQYLCIKLTDPVTGRNNKNWKLHRLLALAFIPNPNNYPCVLHKNDNSLDNTIVLNSNGSVNEEKTNLMWGTVTLNNRQRFENGYKQNGSRNPMHKWIYTDPKGIEYSSITEAAEANNISKSTVQKRSKSERSGWSRRLSLPYK